MLKLNSSSRGFSHVLFAGLLLVIITVVGTGWMVYHATHPTQSNATNTSAATSSTGTLKAGGQVVSPTQPVTTPSTTQPSPNPATQTPPATVTPTAKHSGIEGYAYVGATTQCYGCTEKNYPSTSIIDIKNSTGPKDAGTTLVKTVKPDSNGYFKVDLSPGGYTLSAEGNQNSGYKYVLVSADQYAQVTILTY